MNQPCAPGQSPGQQHTRVSWPTARQVPCHGKRGHAGPRLPPDTALRRTCAAGPVLRGSAPQSSTRRRAAGPPERPRSGLPAASLVLTARVRFLGWALRLAWRPGRCTPASGPAGHRPWAQAALAPGSGSERAAAPRLPQPGGCAPQPLCRPRWTAPSVPQRPAAAAQWGAAALRCFRGCLAV